MKFIVGFEKKNLKNTFLILGRDSSQVLIDFFLDFSNNICIRFFSVSFQEIFILDYFQNKILRTNFIQLLILKSKCFRHILFTCTLFAHY